MTKKAFLIWYLFCVSACAIVWSGPRQSALAEGGGASTPMVELLWPDGAPGAKGNDEADIDDFFA